MTKACELETRTVCRALCQSGKFETGQGGCAAICMSMLGSSRAGPHGCHYAEQVHGKLAQSILTALRSPSPTREAVLDEGEVLTELARAMANDPVAREIARQEHADLFDDMDPEVVEYWFTLAAAAIRALSPNPEPIVGQSGEDWHLIAETPPPVACHVLAGRFDRDCGEWAFAYVSTPPIQPFTHWRMVEPPKGEQP